MGSGLPAAHEETAEKTDETTGKGLPEEALRHLRHGLSYRRLSGVEFGGSLTFSQALTYEDTAQQIENDWYGDGTYLVKTSVDRVAWGDVLQAIAQEDTQAGKDVAQQIEEEEIAQAQEGSPILTRTRGVLAGVLNSLSSGSILATLVSAVALHHRVGKTWGWWCSSPWGPCWPSGSGSLSPTCSRWAVRRVFLEGMLYEKVTAQRFVFLLR